MGNKQQTKRKIMDSYNSDCLINGFIGHNINIYIPTQIISIIFNFYHIILCNICTIYPTGNPNLKTPYKNTKFILENIEKIYVNYGTTLGHDNFTSTLFSPLSFCENLIRDLNSYENLMW